MNNKAETYRKMVAYLQSLGADLGEHSNARLAKAAESSFSEMEPVDLLHYQRVLEATIDNRMDLMDRASMREELTEVVRERFLRGAVRDKNAEAREFRGRLASL